MYCLTTDNGEPPTVETKYELVQSVGRRLLSQGNVDFPDQDVGHRDLPTDDCPAKQLLAQ
jgi:hypothetical protein